MNGGSRRRAAKWRFACCDMQGAPAPSFFGLWLCFDVNPSQMAALCVGKRALSSGSRVDCVAGGFASIGVRRWVLGESLAFRVLGWRRVRGEPLTAYKAGSDVQAVPELPLAHTIRLGLALNFSVLSYEAGDVWQLSEHTTVGAGTLMEESTRIPIGLGPILCLTICFSARRTHVDWPERQHIRRGTSGRGVKLRGGCVETSSSGGQCSSGDPSHIDSQKTSAWRSFPPPRPSLLTIRRPGRARPRRREPAQVRRASERLRALRDGGRCAADHHPVAHAHRPQLRPGRKHDDSKRPSLSVRTQSVSTCSTGPVNTSQQKSGSNSAPGPQGLDCNACGLYCTLVRRVRSRYF